MTLCREVKHRLAGSAETYACELVRYEPGFGVLRYVVDREYVVGGHRLLPGDVTQALFWENRPYTLYIWDLGGTRGRLFYFNIADQVMLRPEEFSWRDLTVDVLVDSTGGIEVLDEHELPQYLSPALRDAIDHAVRLIVSRHREIIEEAEKLLSVT